MIEPGKHKLTEALKGQQADGEGTADATESGAPEPQGQEVAEQTRREQQARPHGVPDRDDYLTNLGRGQQTHG